MLREAATAQVIGARQGLRRRQRAGDPGVARHTRAASPSRRTATSTSPTRTTTSSVASTRSNNITTVVGNNALGTGFSGDNGPATQRAARHAGRRRDRAGRRPDRRRLAQRSHPPRRSSRPASSRPSPDRARTATTATTSRRPRRRSTRPSAVAAAPNGDIYIADTLNYRIRMIDHATGFIHTVAGDGETGGDGADRRRRPGDERASEHAERRRRSRRNGDIYIADMHHNRVRQGRREDAHHHDRRRQRPLGQLRRRRPGDAGDAWPARRASRVVADAARPRDALHRRLLQRPRPRRRPRRHHPRRQRRGTRGVRRADARRVRAAHAAGCTSPTRATTRSSR